MSAWWRRLRRTSPVAIDRALAAVLLVGAWAELLVAGVDKGPVWLGLLLATGYTAPFALRRRHPVLVTVVVTGCVVLMSATVRDATPLATPFAAILLLSYGVGAYAEGRASLAGIAILLAGIAGVSSLEPKTAAGDYIFPMSFGAIGWLIGRAVRTRTLLTEELHEAAVREQEAHERAAAEAAAAERRRIAREMHDVVAHSVSVMVIQAGGARRILARDPARAVAAAAQIERTGREALGEMRRLLGVLHHEDVSQAVLAPQPSMGALDALIARARAAGLSVELSETGERRSLPAGLDLAAYRVVQEGLTNALKYAGGADTAVAVRWGADALELEIADRGPGPAGERSGAGHGLVGMRERVRLYGGTIEAGPREGGGFRIHATLPLVADGAKGPVAA